MRNRPVPSVLTFGPRAIDFRCLLNVYRHASPFMGGFVSGRLGTSAPAQPAPSLGRTARRDTACPIFRRVCRVFGSPNGSARRACHKAELPACRDRSRCKCPCLACRMSTPHCHRRHQPASKARSGIMPLTPMAGVSDDLLYDHAAVGPDDDRPARQRSRAFYLLPPGGFVGALPLPWLAKGEAGAASFGFSFLGFLASRLPRFSPLAMAYLRSGWDGFQSVVDVSSR
jgi:hypothetical protein